MKIKKLLVVLLALTAVCVFGTVGLTGCGELKPPTEFKFELSTRAYSFKTASGADTYQIIINKILNDTTGKSLSTYTTIEREEKGQTIVQPADTAAEKVTMPGSSESVYIWSAAICNEMSIKDTMGTGTVSGNLLIYKFVSNTDAPTLLDGVTDEIPLGHYYISCYSVGSDGVRSAEPAWLEFTVEGQLAIPQFTAKVDGDKMTISLNSSYIDEALRTEGLPESIKLEVSDGTSTQTVTFDDWSYYSTVIGPATSYNYMFLEKEITVKENSTYSIKAVANGDGDKIKDSETVDSGEFTDEFSNATSSGGQGGGPGGPGGPGGMVQKLTAIAPFGAGAESVSVTINAGGTDYQLTGALAEEPGEGSTYTYSLSGKGGMGEAITGTLVLKNDGSIAYSVSGFGPFAAISGGGTWSESDGTITCVAG